MKNFLNKTLLVVSLAASLLLGTQVKAAQAVVTTVGTNLVVGTNGVLVYGITLSGVAGNVAWGLLDSPNGTNRFISPGFTNLTYTPGFCTNFYTNINGFVETNNWYSCIILGTNGVLAYTNFYNLQALIIGQTNSIVTDTNRYVFYQGLTVTNNGAGTLTISYVPLR